MTRRARTRPAPAATAVSRVLRHAGLAPLLAQLEVFAAWPAAVGTAMAQHTWPLGLKEGVLTVGTDHPAWRQELHFRQAQVLEALAARLGKGVVKGIHSVVGQRPDGVPNQPAAPVTPEVQSWATTLTQGIEDPGLRQALARAAAAQQAQRHRGRLGGDR